MTQKADTFWNADRHAVAVERRIIWKFSGRSDELVISIAPDQAVAALSHMSEQTLEANLINAKELARGAVITPQLVYADIKEVADQTVAGSASIDLPVCQLVAKSQKDPELTIEAQMQAAKATLSTAAVAPGDHAIGFLIKDDTLHFYPLLAVTIPEDREAYEEGSATTSDVIPMLPFQA